MAGKKLAIAEVNGIAIAQKVQFRILRRKRRQLIVN